MKTFLCRIGLHQKERYRYYVVKIKRPGRKTYHRNYFYCRRCGKLITPFAKRKIKEDLI